MKENTVVAFQNPSDFQKDPLTEVLQAGARELLAQAVEAEVSVFLGSHAALVDAAGRRRVVRNGYLPERFIQTGIGPVSVRQPRVRDRGDGAIIDDKKTYGPCLNHVPIAWQQVHASVDALNAALGRDPTSLRQQQPQLYLEPITRAIPTSEPASEADASYRRVRTD